MHFWLILYSGDTNEILSYEQALRYVPPISIIFCSFYWLPWLLEDWYLYHIANGSFIIAYIHFLISKSEGLKRFFAIQINMSEYFKTVKYLLVHSSYSHLSLTWFIHKDIIVCFASQLANELYYGISDHH